MRRPFDEQAFAGYTAIVDITGGLVSCVEFTLPRNGNRLMIKRLDHIAVAVKDMQAALAIYEDALGLTCTHVEEIPEQKVKVAFLPTGDSEIELLEPTEADSGVARFLEKQGEGMHHICLEVDDLEATLAELRARGMSLLSDRPQRGAHGRIAFLHPKGTHGVLIELMERETAHDPDPRP